MNAAQAGRLHRLLLDAQHPRTCPITAQLYTPEEMADYGHPRAHVTGHTDAGDGDPEMLVVQLTPSALQGDSELYLDPAGEVWVWSTLPIPPEDCDCECTRDNVGAFSEDRCPVHGRGVRDLDCFRRVAAIGWEIVHRPHPLYDIGGSGAPPTLPCWAYVVREGDPIRDVLEEHRALRARKAVTA